MKGLESIPSIQNLEEAYETFLGSVSTSQLVIYSQWSRFDPRLSEIWVEYISLHWMNLDPMQIHKELKQQPWPNTVGVLLEFVLKLIQKQDLVLFQAWKKLILIGVSRAHFEQYFIGLRKPGGRLMLVDAGYSLHEYLKWGYLSREILFNKAKNLSFTSHSFDYETRQKIAKNLIDQSHRISTHDYWAAIGQTVSCRQAERDLLSFSFLQARGNTKGRYFTKK